MRGKGEEVLMNYQKKRKCITRVQRVLLCIIICTMVLNNHSFVYASSTDYNMEGNEKIDSSSSTVMSGLDNVSDVEEETEEFSENKGIEDDAIIDTEGTLETIPAEEKSDSETDNNVSEENLPETSNNNSIDVQAMQLSPDEEMELDNLAMQNISVLADGEYVIGSQLSSRQVIDVKNGSNSDGANIQMFETNTSKAQRWKVVHDEKGYITFLNAGSGKALDVASGYAVPGTNVQQYTSNGSRAQKWIVLRNDDRTFTIKSAVGKQMALNITGTTAANNSNVDINSENGSDNQKFLFYSTQMEIPNSGQTVADGTYFISSEGSYLENKGSKIQGNINKANSLSQYFFVSYNESNGYYTIKSCSADKNFEADRGDIVPGTSVTLATENSKSQQQYWDITLNEDQSFTITNVANGQRLGKEQNGTNSYTVTVPEDDVRSCTWMLEKAPFYWSEEEMDGFAATKMGQPDIVSGTYQITSVLNENMSLDVTDGSKANWAKIQLFGSNETLAQRWKVEYTDDGYAKLINVNSGKVLDVDGASKKSGVQIQQYGWNNSRAQKWLPIKNENGTYTFYSALGHGLVLDVDSGNAVNRTKVQTYTWNGTNAQMFCFYNTEVNIPSQGKVIEDGYYTISLTADNNKVLDLHNGDVADGTPIQIYSSNGTLAQCFWVEYLEDGYYSIKIAKTGKVVDLTRGGLVPGTVVQQETEDNKIKQRWIISDNGDGSYRIISAANGLCMDAGDMALGRTITTQHISDVSSQKWSFVEYKPSIAEGCYRISTAINSNKVIDIAGGSLVAGGNAQIYSYNKTLAQKWQVRTVEEGIVSLQNLGSGLYLTDVNGNACQMNNSGDAAEAQWILGLQLGHGFTLTNKASGKRLDLSAANTADQTNVGTYDANDTKAQAWNFSAVNVLEPGFYEFAPLSNTGLRLDVAGGSRDNFANVQVYSSNGTLSQRWWVKSVGDGWYTLTACCSAKVLDINGGSAALNANIQQYEANGSNAQKWRFEMGENGIVLKSALGTVADVAGSSGQSGANVWAYEQNGSSGQEWRVFSAATPGKIGWQNPAGYPQVSSRTVILPSYCTGYFTYVTPSRIAIDASREDCVNAFVARAYEYLGTQYIEPWSSWPGDAVDCSGLVLQCLYATGMDMGIYNPYNHRWLPGQTYNSMNWLNNNTFMPVGLNNLQRGDLVYYRNHVAIYIGGGQIIDSWPGQGVTIQGLYSRGNIIGVQRPFV